MLLLTPLRLLPLFLLAMALVKNPNLSENNQSLRQSATIKDAFALPIASEPAAAAGKIQVALLLDVSNSMDGLIDQAKAQLWNMVNLMGAGVCNGKPVSFEVALYEYGRPANGENNGFIRQLHPFTTKLDEISSTLFSLQTNGGSEYCPEVIIQSVRQLSWDKTPNTYRTVFIAGNESFRQGKIAWTEACTAAQEKDVVVNTIYCGPKAQGIREYWNLGGECGNGSFTAINADLDPVEIPTPYDTLLFSKNRILNNTYLAYGERGMASASLQETMDQKNYGLSQKAAAKRMEVKANASLYKNDDWDMVDALEKDPAFLEKLPKSDLPENLQGKSVGEIKKILVEKARQRAGIRTEIARISIQRNAFIEKARTNMPDAGKEIGLETAIQQIIQSQAKRYGIEIR